MVYSETGITYYRLWNTLIDNDMLIWKFNKEF